MIRFLQGVLTNQDKFSQHYADNLDGCGLYLENNVRHAYYTLVRRLFEIARHGSRHNLNQYVLSLISF